MPIVLTTFLLAGLPLVRTTADLAKLTDEDFRQKREFAMTGTVIAALQKQNFIAFDGFGRAQFLHEGTLPAAGDVISMKGNVDVNPDGLGFLCALSYSVVGKVPAPPVTDIAAADVFGGKFDFALVRVRGFVTDASVDEIDPEWALVSVRSDAETVYAFVRNPGDAVDLAQFKDAEVSVTGVCMPQSGGARLFIAPHLELRDVRDISVVTPAPKSAFDAPPLESLHHTSATTVTKMGRRRIVGQVIAAWHGDRFLVRTDDGLVIGVETSGTEGLPACGERVDVAGFPETDFYRINLSHARWRRASGSRRPDDPAIPVVPEDILDNTDGTPRFRTRWHGKPIRLEGTIRNLPAVGNHDGRFNVSCGDYLVPVDVSSCPEAAAGLEIGARIGVEGICVMDVPNWRMNSALPRIRGFSVVVRGKPDIRVLSHPPWWTPGRLTALVGILFAALAGILVWNVSLRRIAERRGRELFRAEIDKVGAELRIDERTRLAVELHDSISQNLTGISMRIDATAHTIDRDRDKALAHLDVASKTLTSCREELRNCIWDLRNDALETNDMNEAIRKTLQRVAGGVKLIVRFNVPRARISDNTAHTLLSAIRELVTNAVRHGQAKTVRIAGARDGTRLVFSVRDDGCGFDPESRPGIGEGHFGLQGIAERIGRLNGTMEIDAAPGRGANVTISIASGIPEGKRT